MVLLHIIIPKLHLPFHREKLRVPVEIGLIPIRVVHEVHLMMILLSVGMVIGVVLGEEVQHMIKTIGKIMIIKEVLPLPKLLMTGDERIGLETGGGLTTEALMEALSLKLDLLIVKEIQTFLALLLSALLEIY